MFELNDFNSIKISVASPEKIRGLSKGEVTKPETINYRTQKPEKDGLFCERIFGPMKDWECHCGKYKKIRYKGVTCEKCGVEITRAKVRRERMGHIELAAPVSHIWYSRGVPSRIGLILDMSPKELDYVIYFSAYVVLDPGTLKDVSISVEDRTYDIKYKSVINDRVLIEIEKKFGDSSETGLKVGMGAEAIRELLQAVDLEKECEETKNIIETSNASQKKLRAVKRIEVLESFRKSGNRPEWMILTVLPVLPPDLRPMLQLDGGRFASSDLNDLYRRVINRNNRLKRMLLMGAPEMIVKNEKRMLQEAVDALIDNGRRGKALNGPSNRELKSLSGMLRGKQGRFRQNLLGKRVDYSGRSVIVVGPELKLYQCGLPKEMAIELFKPFVMKKLVESGLCNNVKSAKRTVEKAKPFVWDVLEEVIKEHPVLLNRAPTLHRLSIQAFEPVLIEGRAIKIHPLVCTAFNADFDGDQMAVHVPLSVEAQAEARFLMLSSNNILKLSDGKPVMQPSQDMVLGAYYLTIIRREEGKYYRWSGARYYECSADDEGAEKYVPGAYISEDEAMMAYQMKLIHMQDEIKVRRTVTIPNGPFAGQTVVGTVKTTVGRIIFNNEMPQDLGFVKREKPEDWLKYEISYDFIGDSAVAVGKKQLGKIVERCFKTGGAPRAADVLDRIKTLGYKYSTVGAITTSVFDMHIPAKKQSIVAETEQKVFSIEKKFQRGLMREEDRYAEVINAWDDATNRVLEELKNSQDKFNPIWMMANSGARGSLDQMKQLSGMRGLVVNPQGKKIEVPVKACYRQGLSVLEYFISSHGGRKGLADTALKTADSGYLTRRLVDVAQDVIVREEDCMAGSKKPRGTVVRDILDSKGEIIEGLEDRIQGRFVAEDVIDKNGNVIVEQNGFVTDSIAKEIIKAGIKQVSIRSVFTCDSRYGVCAKCYGKNMSTNTPVQPGEAVGVIAAQSIGEPGTQLTMRTFHTGGIAATSDITQGLPRVEELFEARKPKGCATLCEASGVISLDSNDGEKVIVVRDPVTGEQKKEYKLPFNAELLVKDGDTVQPGTQLNVGSIYPQDLLRISGKTGVQDYILEQIQAAYRSQSVEINDKHVEIIVRQMLRKVKIERAGKTSLLPGETVDMFTVDEENKRVMANGGSLDDLALQKQILLGITKAALSTDSFLSAASFQETAKVLTDAAIKNKVDPLIGLKENVIIGKLIPAGTGVKEYKNMSPVINPGYNSTVENK